MKFIRPIILLGCCILILTGCGSLSEINAKSAIDAMNRGDVDTYLKDWADDAVFIYPGNATASGEVKGKKAIREWFDNWRKMFPDLKFTIKDIYLKNNIYFGNSNVMAVHWEASGTNKFGQKVNSSGIGVVTINGTKISKVQDYIFDAHKLKDFWGE